MQPYIIMLSNKHRFGYLQGNCSNKQKKQFLQEYAFEECNGINMPLTIVSTNSNLNYKQYIAILSDFNILPTPQHDLNKSKIEKLVTYRNRIAHGENSVVVHETDVNEMISCVMEMIDTTIGDINQYVITEPFLS